ncbi:hypothetical protein DOY81_010026 [Sarcophaga bullata]|nr:hypothetical protein DOY81_010026 [Sarcophaga bullata]
MRVTVNANFHHLKCYSPSYKGFPLGAKIEIREGTKMDDTPINLENILEQAPSWTFAGDCTLLQWMTQISKDLKLEPQKTTVGSGLFILNA